MALNQKFYRHGLNSHNSKFIGYVFKLKESHSGLFFNGGVDAARFELFKKYICDSFTQESAKVCSIIEKLGIVA